MWAAKWRKVLVASRATLKCEPKGSWIRPPAPRRTYTVKPETAQPMRPALPETVPSHHRDAALYDCHSCSWYRLVARTDAPATVDPGLAQSYGKSGTALLKLALCNPKGLGKTPDDFIMFGLRRNRYRRRTNHD
jgi:hypothetical protein